jgi:hypothetical protein
MLVRRLNHPTVGPIVTDTNESAINAANSENVRMAFAPALQKGIALADNAGTADQESRCSGRQHAGKAWRCATSKDGRLR